MYFKYSLIIGSDITFTLGYLTALAATNIAFIILVEAVDSNMLTSLYLQIKSQNPLNDHQIIETTERIAIQLGRQLQLRSWMPTKKPF